MIKLTKNEIDIIEKIILSHNLFSLSSLNKARVREAMIEYANLKLSK